MEEREPKRPEGSGTSAGRRQAPKQSLSKKGKGAVIAVCVAAAVLLGGYLGLCAYASGDRVIPGTYLGDVDLSGLTVEEAGRRIEEASRAQYDQLEIPIQVGDKTVNFSAKEAGVSLTGDGEEALRAGKGSFLASGWNYLAGLLGREDHLQCAVSVANEDYLARTQDAVAKSVAQRVEDPHWDIEETDDGAELVLYRGRTGQNVDLDRLRADLLDALAAGGGTVTAQIVTDQPAPVSFDTMKQEVDREPENASLDVEKDQIIPHKLGLALDAAQAKTAFDGMKEGESVRLPLETTQPEITTLKLRAGLFRDLLGEGTSKISGDANRVGNVKLAAAACNGVILLPGEQMSYNKTTGQRTEAKGYRKASGYTAKGIEDMVGGGVCQPSSTLYLACLNANLEIVERSNHRYTVSYMPDGMDATVSWPNLDYVFANNTPYPIKVTTNVENRVLTVRIYGTKTDNSYVKMESVRLSTTPAGTEYQADESIPQGTTKVLQGAHTGKKVQVYKNIYNGDGTLRERILISTDTYRPGAQIIGYNPADGAPDGSVPPTAAVDPVTGFPLDPETGLPIDPETGMPAEPPLAGEGVTTDPGADTPAAPSEPAEPAEPAQPETPAEPPVTQPETPPVLPAQPEPVAQPEGIPE